MVPRARTAKLCISDTPNTVGSSVVPIFSMLSAFSVFFGSVTRTAHAQGWIEGPPTRPNMPPTEVVRTASNVRISIDGRVARVEIEELFRNSGAGVAEGS